MYSKLLYIRRPIYLALFLNQSDKLRKLKSLNMAAMKSLSVLCMFFLVLTGPLMLPSAEATRLLSEATPGNKFSLSLLQLILKWLVILLVSYFNLANSFACNQSTEKEESKAGSISAPALDPRRPATNPYTRRCNNNYYCPP